MRSIRSPLGSLAALAALALAPALHAQATGKLTGRVTDAQSGQPIEGAQVRLAGTGFGGLTLADGRYFLVGVPGGSYTLIARRVGYQAHEITGVRIAEGTTSRRDITLAPATATLSALVIEAERPALREQGATGTAITTTVHESLPLTTTSGQLVNGVPVSPPTAPARVMTKQQGYTGDAGARQAPSPGAAAAANTEAYDVIDENPFFSPRATPLSTFSIDVDRASYGNVRRHVREGARPPRDAVRIEELVNYFPYAYPQPGADAPVSITTEVAAAPWHPAHRLVRIGLQARHVATDRLPPSNLVFLIDVSGSMQDEHKLPLVKESLRLLVSQLRPEDRVALVVYAGAAGLVLPSTPASRRDEILRAIGRLEAGGSTAGGAGLRLAYRTARASFLAEGTNRVILATDGDFNVGESSDAAMVQLVEQERGDGIALTVLGFGMGNYKDSRLEKLADRGNGNYAYIDDIAEAQKSLVHEMGGTLMTVAKDVKLQVEFNPARVAAYRLLGYENRALRDQEFNDDRVDAGDIGADHSVTALYEIVPAGAPLDVTLPGTDTLRYRAPAATREGPGDELLYVKLRYKRPGSDRSRLLAHAVPDETTARPSADFRFAAAVAEYGLLLRDSPHKGEASFARVVAAARGSLGGDPFGYRKEFVALVEATRGLERISDARR